MMASVATVLAVAAISSQALAQDASNNFSVKFMAYNIWNVGANSKIWDPAEKAKGNLVYSDSMKNLLLGATPDVLVLPELNNNNRTFNGKNILDEFTRNTIDVLNSRPLKQDSFVDMQKNLDEGAKGSGSVFSSIPFENLPGDTIRINPGNGFPETIVTGIHLDYQDAPEGRLGEAKELNEAAVNADIPMVILGDFNAGDVSERGLESADQQAALFGRYVTDPNAGAYWTKLANQYVPQGQEAAFADYFTDMRTVENGTVKYRNVLTDYFNNHKSEFPGISSISQMSWRQWEEIIAKDMASKGLNFIDETYPVADNIPVTLNVLKKQYQLFQLDRNREQFGPSKVGDGRATWTSDGEDSTNTWESWDRVTIDHIMMSRPFAKWAEISQTDEFTGNLSDKAKLPSGGSLSDHEPVAQNLRWIGPQLQTYNSGTEEKTRLVWGSGAYDFAGRNKEFFLTRNNNRNDIYLGQIADADGNPTIPGLTLDEKKTLLNCKSADARFQQAIKDYCIDDHSFIGETLVTDGGTVIVDEDAALGNREANLRLANGGLRIIGQNMGSLDRALVLEQPAWIDVADAANSVSVDQSVTGMGSLTKLGDGTLILAAANSYTGGTLVQKGTLQAGVDNSFVSGTDYRVNNGTLDLNGFDLSISTLSGTGGKVRLGDAALAVNQVANTTYDGVIEGAGGLTKTRTGSLTLNGQSTYTGSTIIDAGKLVVGDSAHPNASLSSAVTVHNNATLGGVGFVGGLTVSAGGIVAPGNSIGKLTVNGNVAFDTGSIYQVEIAPSGANDWIAASGTAKIAGGRVEITKALGTYTPGSHYTILATAGGVTGTFAELTQDMPFVDLGLTYDPANVYLDVARNEVTFPSVGITHNQRSTAAAIEALAGGNAVYDAVVQQENAESARFAFDALSGELHASSVTALVNDSQFIRNAANNRLRAAFGDVAAVDVPVMGYGPDAKEIASADVPKMAAWGQVFGNWSETKGNGNAAKLDQSTGGFVTGFDAALADNWRLGVMAGYSRSSFDVDASRSSGNSDNYHVGVYGGGHFGAVSLRSGLAYTWHSIETGRTAAFAGFNEHLSADYDAGTFQAFGELGYRIDTARVAFEPFANLAHVRVKTDGFSERGGSAALTANSDTNNTTFSTLGLRVSAPFSLGTIDVEARGMVGWIHAYGDTSPVSSLAFATGNGFDVAGIPIAEDTAAVEAGIDFNLSRQSTLGVSYTGQFGSGLTQNAVDAKFAVKF